MRELFSRIAACREHSFCSRRLREIYFITPIKPFARETVLTSCARLSQHRAAASLASGRSRPTPFENASAAFIEKSPLHYRGPRARGNGADADGSDTDFLKPSRMRVIRRKCLHRE
jgi:hypothetical protein